MNITNPLAPRLREIRPADYGLAVLLAVAGVVLNADPSPLFLLACAALPLTRVFAGQLVPVLALASAGGYWYWLSSPESGGQPLIWCLTAVMAGWYGRRLTQGRWTLLAGVALPIFSLGDAGTLLPVVLAVIAGYAAGRLALVGRWMSSPGFSWTGGVPVAAAVQRLRLQLKDLRRLTLWDVGISLVIAVPVIRASLLESVSELLACCLLLPLVRLSPVVVGSVVALLSALGYANVGFQNFNAFGWEMSLSVSFCAPAALAGWHAGRRLRDGWSLLALVVAGTTGALANTQLSLPPLVPVFVLGLGYLAARVWTVNERLTTLNRQLLDAQVEVESVRDENRSLEQRTALARDLHDVIGHHLSVISLATEAATLRPEITPESLDRIRTGTSAAMRELDILLRSLRESDEKPPMQAYQGLDDIEGLSTALRDAGIDAEVRLLVTEAVPDGLQLAIYRITQEAITNILRHSGARRAEVHIETSPREVRIRIDDDGVGFGVSPVRGGRGLTGITERVKHFGGTWSRGTSDWGGSRIEVVLPLGRGSIQS